MRGQKHKPRQHFVCEDTEDPLKNQESSSRRRRDAPASKYRPKKQFCGHVTGNGSGISENQIVSGTVACLCLCLLVQAWITVVVMGYWTGEGQSCAARERGPFYGVSRTDSPESVPYRRNLSHIDGIKNSH